MHSSEVYKTNMAGRGFRNLLGKEMKAWSDTRRWLGNLLIWSIALGGVVAIMLFVLPSMATTIGDPAVAQAGGPEAFGLAMGTSVYFEMGMMAIAIGTIILTQDAIVGEKENGVAEWVLSTPVSRKAYLLSKFWVNIFWILLLLVFVPSVVVYGLLYLRLGGFFPIQPYLAGVGLMILHTLFYLVLTISLGAWFDQRSAILGVSLGMVMGGMVLGSILKPLLYVTPWMLGKIANLIVSQTEIPAQILYPPILASVVWIVIFIAAGVIKFNKYEF